MHRKAMNSCVPKVRGVSAQAREAIVRWTNLFLLQFLCLYSHWCRDDLYFASVVHVQSCGQRTVNNDEDDDDDCYVTRKATGKQTKDV